MALCATWAAAGAVAYALGRLFLSPAGAAVFAIAAIFNPCAVDFVPGKDPAQLLTICAMLWAWLGAIKPLLGGPSGRAAMDGTWLAVAAGALLVLGSIFGLIHIWVALAVYAATAWQARRVLLRPTLHAALGAAGVVVVIYLAVGWNIPWTLIAVWRRWSEVQHTFTMNRAIWYVIGLPIFLLFLSPAVLTLGVMALSRKRLNFGTRLALCTVAVMLFIYFALGMTYELPRLWVAFLPPLMLGLCVDRPLLRGSETIWRRRVAAALVLIVLTQTAFTAMHWTLFDVREVEYRLTSQRYYQ
jgi:hypothetical protein